MYVDGKLSCGREYTDCLSRVVPVDSKYFSL